MTSCLGDRSKCGPFFLLLPMAFLWATIPALGQNVELRGIVTDPSGAVIPGASVQVTNTETNVASETLTNDAGQYVVPNLRPGTYAVTVELPGFKVKTIRGIVLQVGQKARVDIALDVGEVTEHVEVQGQSPLLDTETATTGEVIDAPMVAKLPLNGRDFMQLALLTAGVNEGVSSAWTGEQLFSGNGLTGMHANYVMDGITNRESATNTIIEKPSPDAIQEFKAETGMFSAETQGAGLLVKVITKSGTNEVHGSVYEYLRNDVLDASGFFPSSGRRKPALRRNQFGLSVGGPFQHDSHFWFFNYEGLRERRENVRIGRIPTPDQLSGKFDVVVRDPVTQEPFPNNQIPAERIDPVLKGILSFYPAPNRPDLNANFINQSPLRDDGDKFLIKTDHHFSTADQLSVRLSFDDRERFRPGLFPVISGAVGVNKALGVAINHYHTFSPTLLNQLTLGATRWVDNDEAEAKGTQFVKNLGVLGIELDPGQDNEIGLPHEVGLSTFAGLSDSQTVLQEMNNFEIADTATWIRGRHSVKFGGSVYRTQFKNFPLGTKNSASGTYTGQFTGHPVADALLDAPATIVKAGNSPITFPRQTRIGFFLQDDWRVSERLTLNLGIRYDLDLPVNDIILGAFDTSIGGFRFPGHVVEEAGKRGFDVLGFFQNVRPDIPVKIDEGKKSIYDADANNFSPRIGFAYSLDRESRTVVRGGAGIFFAPNPAIGTRCTSVVPPFTNRFQTFSDPATPSISLVSTGAGGAAERQPIRVWTFPGNRKLLTGYVQMWSLNVQRQISPSLMVEVGYNGNHGLKNLTTLDINQVPVPGPGSLDPRRPFQGFGPVQVTGNNQFSTYHGMNARAVKRMSHGLSFLASYAVGKALTNGDEYADGRQQDINCPVECEKALAGFDMRQRFTLSYAYELPMGRGYRVLGDPSPIVEALLGGWEFGGIVTLQSGTPVTPSASGIVGSNTGRPTRPNRIGDGNLPSDQRSREGFWDRSAFVAPPPFTFGTSGRNVLIGPGLATWDLSLRKDFAFWSEEAGLEFRAEFFNVLNHTNFGTPVTDINSPNFGKIFSLATTAREIQFALRLHW